MTEIADFVLGNRERFRAELFEFLQIPSISTDSEHGEDVDRCAGWLAGRLEEAGLEGVEVEETDGNPVVVADHRVAGEAPTVLVYGHYDVQPPDPVDEWVSPAFEPSVRDGRVYARGATDDKGQVYMHVKALETRLRREAGLPVNVKLVLEGEEEIGSPNLEPFLRENRERLDCDAVVISDTGMFARDVPSVTVGLRGMVYQEITFRGPSSDLHSGLYGGTVVNPANALADTLGRLRDDDRRITIPGFYEDVREMTDEERATLEALPFDEEDYRQEVGARQLGGEAGRSTLERAWFRPTLDVNGLVSGYTGEGAKTVLPSRATAKLSMRLVPDQDPDRVQENFQWYVRALAPDEVDVDLQGHHGARPWAADPEGPVFQAASDALEEAFGREPVFVRNGGTIPIVPLFEELFGAPVLLLGFGLPGANLHAPNEWFDLEMYELGIETVARLYDHLVQRGV